MFVQCEFDDLKTIRGAGFRPSVVKSISIPPQIETEEADSIKVLGEVISKCTESVTSSDFVLKILIVKSMGLLWALLSELQIIEHLNLFKLQIPSSWSLFAEAFDKLTSLDLFDSEDLVQKLFYIPEQEPVSLNFQIAGYDTSIFLVNAHAALLLYAI